MKQREQPAVLEFRSTRHSRAEADIDDGMEIDIRAMALKLWRGKWIIAISTLIAGVIGFLLISQIEPRYVSSAKVMFDISANNIVDLDQVIVRSAINENTLQNEIEVLRSTNLIERVIEKLALDKNPEFNPLLRTAPDTMMTRLRSKFSLPPEVTDILRDLGILSAPSRPPSPEQMEEWGRLAVIRTVLSGLSLQPIPGSKVIAISYTSRSPRTSAQIANTIAEEYIVDQLDAKLEATRTATDWLSGRVDGLRDRVQNAEEAVEAARARLSQEAGQGLDITRQQLQSLNASLSVARQQTTAAEATYKRLEIAVESGSDFGAIPEFRQSTLIQTYRTREAELLSQRASLEETVAEGHPVLKRIDAQLEEIRRNIREEALRVVEAARSSWVSKQAEDKTIEEDVRLLETRALEQSREEVEIRQLEREAQASRVLYENFLSRLKETSEQEALQSADARILSPAEPPFGPIAQSKQRILAASIAIGVLAGVAIIFLLDRLNNTFRSAGQVEDLTGQTILGTVPAIGRRIRRRSVLQHFREKPKSALAEAVRNLRTSILLSNVDKPAKVVMFTSSVPREGKSTTSMLVAMTSRQMGKSAIILDCDLRLPSLSRLLNADDGQPGLLSVLDGTAQLDDAIYKDEDTGLHVLMTKPKEPRSNINAADILSSHRFEQLIKDLKERYDLVIMDTPPALVVADARILSTYADAIVYAVRWDHTPRGAVLEGLKELQAINAPIAGIALTIVDEARAGKYAYDGYSYYKGRYKEYYVS